MEDQLFPEENSAESWNISFVLLYTKMITKPEKFVRHYKEYTAMDNKK